MDSLTQIALGACTAAACVPREQRRKAALAGALLGTLPDLDVFLDYGDPVANFTMHRGFSHSLPVLFVAGLAIWAILRLLWAPVKEFPGRWLAAILLSLLTHPLLDAHTAYGTQLFWPSESPPVSWATLFIIDPLYTLPLLAGMVVVLIKPDSRAAGRWLAGCIAASTLYLGWSWTAQGLVAENARRTLESEGLRDPDVFITPTPFNTLLWRVVVRKDGGHLEGYDSLAVNDGPIRFVFHPSEDTSLAAAAHVPAVARLKWFANGFIGATVEDDTLLVHDLRMGRHPDYVFRHAVASRGNPSWRPLAPRRLPATIRRDSLVFVWNRIWNPAADQTGS